MQNSQIKIFNINPELNVFLIQLLKNTIEDYESNFSIISGEIDNCMFNNAEHTHNFYNPDGHGIFLYLYKGEKLAKYFGGILANVLKEGSLHLYKDIDSGEISLEFSSPCHEITISPKELINANIRLDNLFKHLDKLHDKYFEPQKV